MDSSLMYDDSLLYQSDKYVLDHSKYKIHFWIGQKMCDEILQVNIWVTGGMNVIFLKNQSGYFRKGTLLIMLL